MNTIHLLESFRDFFHFGRKESLRKAYINITDACDTGYNPENIDWNMEEFTFNRLFVGPMPPLAPAVASVYLDPEGLIQGKVTAEIRAFYMSIGLCLDEVGREPEDSIAYELDACRHLLLLSREVPEAEEIYRNFLTKHIAVWIPEFCTRALAHCTESLAVKEVLMLLTEWVEGETGKITHYKEMV